MLVVPRARACLAVAAYAVVLSACGERDAPEPAPSPAGATIAVGIASSPTTLLPPLATSALDGEIGAILYLGLNYAEWRDGAMAYPMAHPLALARDREIEGSRLTYRLDTSRRWSDGVPVRAADVVFTYDLLRELDHLPMSVAAARIDSVRAADDSTVTFHFDGRYPGMLYDTGVGILPAHIYAGLQEESLSGAVMAAIGEAGGLVVSGPFTVVEWRPADRLVLAWNPEFPGPAGPGRIVFSTVPDPTSRLAGLRAGDLNLVQVDSYRDAVRGAAGDDVRVLRVPQRGYDYIAWNPAAHTAFADRRVRHALSLAIDRSAILTALEMTDFAEIAHGPYGSIFGELAPPAPVGGDYDPEAARRLLSEAGWVDGDGDGIREKGASRLAFRLEIPAGQERRSDAAQIIQAQLAEVGADVEIRSQEFNSLFTRARERDYEAVLLGWQVGLDPDISFFWADPESPVNVVGYDGPEARSEIERALAAETAGEAAPHWREAARRIAVDYPYAFLWYFDFVWLSAAHLEGIRMDPVGFFRNPHEWSVATGT